MDRILHLRIFLSSPGDVAAERDIAREIIKDMLPYDPFIRGKATLDVISWDDPHARPGMSAHLTPQIAINRRLPRPSECDVVIVILWSRMGTPLPVEIKRADGKPYQSGTEWEFEDALWAAEKDNRPIILLYRRTEEPMVGLGDPKLSEKREQYQKVVDFFSGFRGNDGTLSRAVATYATVDEFREILRQNLESVLSNLLDTEHEELKARIAELELQLGDAGTELKGYESAAPLQIEAAAAVERLAVVGTSIVEFAAGVPAAKRSNFLNTLLLAQLAANRRMQDWETCDAAGQWYDIFMEVLGNIGFQVKASNRSQRLTSTRCDRARSEIVKVIATTLGPVGACESILLAMLVGHLKVDTRQVGIKAFQSLAREALGPGNGRFEVVNIGLTEGGGHQVIVHGFQYDSHAATEGIMFSEVEAEQLVVFHRLIEFEVNLSLFEAVSDAIAAKVSGHSAHCLFDLV